MTGSVEFVTVAAVAENGVIGRAGELPWPSIETDKRQYRDRIADSPVVIGRRTFDSMRDDLPGRAQIVLSRSTSDFGAATAHAAASVEETIEVVESLGESLAYVIGGAGVYELFQPVGDRMILSKIPGEYDGDAFFPKWDVEEWTLRERTEYDEFTLEIWERVGD